MKTKQHGFLVIGDNPYERKQKIDEILSSLLSPEEKEHAITRLSAHEISEEHIAHMKVLPFLAEKQVFIINNLDKLRAKTAERLVTFLERPAPGTYVILEDSEFTNRDTQAQRLRELCVIYTMECEMDDTIRSRIITTLRDEGRSITPEALELLIQRIGGSSAFLTQALEKIILATTKGVPVTEECIVQCVESLVSFDIFDLTNALSAKNFERTLEIFSYLINEGADTGELMGMIGWQLRRLFEAKTLMERQVPLSEIQRRLRINAYYFDRFVKQVRTFRKQELVTLIHELFSIDNRVKQGQADATRELELLFIRLCGYQPV